MQTLMEFLSEYKDKFAFFTKESIKITPDNVFQNGSASLRSIIDSILSELLLENTILKNHKNLEELLDKLKEGKKCLILPEHYSNFDYPIIHYLMRKTSNKCSELAERCIAVAGMKLSEENKYISLLTGAYDRIYVYPGKSIKSIQDPKIQSQEIKRCKSINITSMRFLNKAREEGRIVVVFPAGTRYRPGKPETKRGLREIDSYIKSSDYMVLLSINGNCLEVSDSGNMMNDIIKKDNIVLESSPVLDCVKFRNDVIAKLSEMEDKKQAIVDNVTNILEEMHNKN